MICYSLGISFSQFNVHSQDSFRADFEADTCPPPNRTITGFLGVPYRIQLPTTTHCHSMKSVSEDSNFDYDRFNERIQYTQREASLTPLESLTSSTDLYTVAVGGQFPALDAFPCELEVSEAGENDLPPSSRDEAENSVPASPPSSDNNPLLGSAFTAHTSTRARIGVYIQPDDYNLQRQTSDRRIQYGRKFSSGHPSISSENTEEHHSDVTSIAHGENHNTTPTPTPNFSLSRTPSHCSIQTEDEDYNEFVEPESPHPFSEWNLYDPSRNVDLLGRFPDN